MEELLSEMNTLKHQNEEQRGKLKILSTEKGKLSVWILLYIVLLLKIYSSKV